MQLSVDAKNAALQGIADKLNEGTNSVLSLFVGETLAAEIALLNPVQKSRRGGTVERLEVFGGSTELKGPHERGLLLARQVNEGGRGRSGCLGHAQEGPWGERAALGSIPKASTVPASRLRASKVA